MSTGESDFSLPPPEPPARRVLGEPSARRTLGRLLASYGYTVTSIAASLVSIPLFLHHLGREEFGAWIVASTIAGYSIILQLGVAQATANRFAEGVHRSDDHDAVRTLATGFWAIGRFTFPAALTVLAIYLLTGVAAPHLTALRLCLLASGLYLFELPFTIIGVCARTAGHLAVHQMAASASLVLRVVAGALALAAGTGATGLIVSQAVAGVAFHAVMWRVLRRTLPAISVHPHHGDAAIRRAMRANSAGFLALHLGGTIVLALDSVVIAVALGSGDVTSYAIAQRVLALIAGVVSATAGAFYPDLVAARAKGSVDGLRRLFARMSLVSAAVAGASVGTVLVCTRPAIAHWVGEANVLDAATFWCLVGVFLVQVVLYPYDVLLTSTSEHRRYGGMSLVEAAINLTLSMALIGRFGLVAVAGSTLFGRLATTGPVLVRRSARVLETRLVQTMDGLRTVALPVVLSVAVMVWLRLVLGTDRADLAVTVVAGLAVYAVALAAPSIVKLGPRASFDLYSKRVRPVFALRRR